MECQEGKLMGSIVQGCALSIYGKLLPPYLDFPVYTNLDTKVSRHFHWKYLGNTSRADLDTWSPVIPLLTQEFISTYITKAANDPLGIPLPSHHSLTPHLKTSGNWPFPANTRLVSSWPIHSNIQQKNVMIGV